MILLLCLFEFAVLLLNLSLAQEGLGTISEAPSSAIVPLNSNASFTCSAIGNIFWSINSGQVSTSFQVQQWASNGIIVPLSTPSSSTVIVAATLANNRTSLRCFVEEEGKLAILNRSSLVMLTVYGEPSPPSNLTLTLPASGLGVWLSWQRGFALEGEDVAFIITSTEVTSEDIAEISTSSVSIMLTPSPVGRENCLWYRFTVASVNGFSRSSSNVSQDTIIPTVPVSLESDEFNITTSFEDPITTSVSFNAPSPCEEYPVQRYKLLFSEVANSTHFEQILAPAFNTSHSSSNSSVTLSVTGHEGLLPGKVYWVTIIATNGAGSSSSNVWLSTTGLLLCAVDIYNYLSANITCVFVANAPVLGCYVSFGTLVGITITKEEGSDMASGCVLLPGEIPTDWSEVTVGVVLADGSVRLDIIRPTIAITTATIPTDRDSTSTQELYGSTTTEFSNSINSTNTRTEGPQVTFYISIGAAGGTILILGCTILVVTLTICALRKHMLRKDTTDKSEQLKVSPAGRAQQTGRTGNNYTACMVKDTTCDNQFYEASCNESAPTYETVGATKHQQFSCPLTSNTAVYAMIGSANEEVAGRTQVPNPVYERSVSLSCKEAPPDPAMNKAEESRDPETTLSKTIDNSKAGSVHNPLYASTDNAECNTANSNDGAVLPMTNPLYEISASPMYETIYSAKGKCPA